MLRSLATRIAQRATFVKIMVLALLFAAGLLYMLWIINHTLIIPSSFRFIELEPAWHPQEIYSWLDINLRGDRAVCILQLIKVDYVNIVIYSLMFSFLISWLYKKSIPATHPRMLLNLLPFAAGIADVTENILMVGVMSSGGYPVLLNVVILVKLAIGSLCMLAIAAGAMSAIRTRKT